MPAATGSPRITVIIATYNCRKTLKLALQSVLAQDFTDFEVWVVGDACTDDSAEVVASFGDARLHCTNLAENTGSQGGPNNEGLRRARGEYIAYLGHDDLWFPWHLSGLLAHLESTNADLVHSLSIYFRPVGIAGVLGSAGKGRTYDDYFVFPSSWLHRRAVVLACGGWGEHRKLSRGVDMDLLSRLYAAGKRIEPCPHLSVLKFESTWWGIYSLQGTPPQQEHLQRILDAPQHYCQQLLIEVAAFTARQESARPQIGRLLRAIAKDFRDEIFKRYGRNRPPLRQYLTWKFQRQRRSSRKRRGLS